MRSFYIEQRDARVHCLQFGEGDRLLIALHGFGDRARMFTVLKEALGQHYKVVAIDWPFHGQTDWKKNDFTKQDLLEIIRGVLQDAGVERFNLMGFSFGARLAQAMLPELSPQLDKLYLLSPDGIKTKGMSMAVRTPMWVRRLLYRILKKPGWFFSIVRFGKKIGLVPPLIHHFLTNNLNRPERFQRTFGCWLSLDSFYLRRRRIKAVLKETGLPTDVYIGKNDPMLGQQTLQRHFGGLPNVRMFLLDQGHRLVGEELAAEMLAAVKR
ncbi:MAG: alpha/beta hydrolase [Lewinellaceae bacterium]|nr:alpha/beta hydrolase [Lewinellaceae bacterium]